MTTQTGTVEINLDIATMEGKTWLAAVTGAGGQYGVQREFVNAVERNTSRSGRTGTATFIVGPGVYESNEGRKRLGRRWWIVKVDETIGAPGELVAANTDRATALAAL